MAINRFLLAALLVLRYQVAIAESGKELSLTELGREPRSFNAKADESGNFTWWLPSPFEALVLPLSAGIVVESSNEPIMRWLRNGSPWDLSLLSIFGVRYGDRTVVVIVPWPHYAELVFERRVGVRFTFPGRRHDTTPCEIVSLLRGSDPLEVALAFRAWRESAKETGAIPKPRPLQSKAAQLPAVTRLFGAPHIYLWGPALFSRHDVERTNWVAFADSLRHSGPETFSGRLLARFTASQLKNLSELASSEYPANYLTRDAAAAIDALLADRGLLTLSTNVPLAEVVRRNSTALHDAFPGLVHNPRTWGDGFSIPLLESLRTSGVDRALLLLSDFYGRSPRPDVALRAAELGFLLGPYDSYHSVHDPNASPEATWETAQFDQPAYETGRILNFDGTGHGGFRNRGYHFSPAAAWPYVRARVQSALDQTPFSAWFVDCDATAECFDDYNPRHPATRVDDLRARRERLHWLEADKRLVIGSENGSALFADAIHFGHGVQTPYLGHLAEAFNDPKSPSFLGRQWPPDTPAKSFMAVPVPTSLRTPFFDPRVRIPLYQAALGDEVITTHHWSFDSFKFSDVEDVRELMELLYMVPPMYHLNRETWPQRRDRILRHFAYWSPIHRKLATAPLTRFEWLTPDRLLQRTTFKSNTGDVTMTVNFSDVVRGDYPAKSATVTGRISVDQRVYRFAEK